MGTSGVDCGGPASSAQARLPVQTSSSPFALPDGLYPVSRDAKLVAKTIPSVEQVGRDQADVPFRDETRRLMQGPLILDPTVLMSAPHVAALSRARAEFFVPGAWSELIQDRRWDSAELVLSGLSWRLFRSEPYLERPHVRDLLSESVSIGRPFTAPRSVLRDLAEMYPGRWDFRNPVDAVLADEYAFLKAHSAMLARIRGPFHALRRRGLALFDAGDRFLQAKRDFLAPHRGFKFILAVLIPLAVLQGTQDPGLRLLGVLANEVLAFYDPIP